MGLLSGMTANAVNSIKDVLVKLVNAVKVVDRDSFTLTSSTNKVITLPSNVFSVTFYSPVGANADDAYIGLKGTEDNNRIALLYPNYWVTLYFWELDGKQLYVTAGGNVRVNYTVSCIA